MLEPLIVELISLYCRFKYEEYGLVFIIQDSVKWLLVILGSR